jgi:hypothetical protein
VGQLVAPVPSRRTAYLVGRRQLPAVLVVAGYLLLAVTLTWRLWADPAGRVPTDGGGVTNDIFLSTWFMRYAAIAVAHGRLPALASTALNAPQGVNVMWNTSLLLPAVVLAPVTMLAGPDASLTVMLTLGFAGSAATMFLVLRRWGAGLAAAAAGGALFGFSPALRQAAMYHYHLQFALLVPLIIDAVLLLVTGRGRPVRTGVWLGLLTVAQLLTAEEVLADIAVALIVILAVLAASRPQRLRSAIRPLSIGAAIAVAVVAVLGGYAIWTQFHGPLAASGIPWDTALYGNQPADFVTAPNAMLLHGSGFLRFTAGTGQRLSEYLGYLGWPLLVLVPVATIGCWRDLRVRTAGVTFIVLELLSIGGRTAPVGGLSLSPVLLPWHWLERLPVLSQMLPNRLSILGDAAAAAVLAFAVGRVRALAAQPHRRWLPAAAAAAGIAAVLPVLPLPLDAAVAGAAPDGWTAVIARLGLRPGASILQLPITPVGAMAWQAATGADVSIVGGYCIAPIGGGKTGECTAPPGLTGDQDAAVAATNLLAAGLPAGGGPPGATVLSALASWHPTAVITAAGPASPLGQYLVRILGPPTARDGVVLGWRMPRHEVGWRPADRLAG